MYINRHTCKTHRMSEVTQAVPSQPNAASRLGTEPVGRLLFKFSIPAITGMLVSALYNLVDRIFVGRGIDTIAVGGLSLILPLMTITLAFSMLFGIGTANLISMRLGQGRKQEAENALNHCFFLLIIVGLVLMAAGLIFLEPILSVLGAEEGSLALDYARSYFRIILFGSVFSTLGFGFSHCTRSQGFPLITMIGMLIGAGLNIILDPIFIFVFKWGIEGVAWATVISQFVSLVWILSFSFGKKAIIRLKLKSFKPSGAIVLQIMSFGSSQFLMQFIMSGVQLINNISVSRYGAAALGVENGGDIALAGVGIIGSVAMLIMMSVFGINQGAQPILGYNYGAKRFDRVMRAYLIAITAATSICAVGFLLGQIFPRQLVSLFTGRGSSDLLHVTTDYEVLMQFAPLAMRIVMATFILNGFQVVSTNLFVVTGRPKISIILSLLRQCIILIPFILIFGKFWGLWGVVAAGPAADVLSFIITGSLIIFELRKLRQQSKVHSY